MATTAKSVAAVSVAPAPVRKRPAIRKTKPAGHLVGYARVSTAEQDPALQLDALNSAGCWRVFTDHASGSREDRPELVAAVDSLRRVKGSLTRFSGQFGWVVRPPG